MRNTTVRRFKSTAHHDNTPTVSSVQLQIASGMVVGSLPSTACHEPYSCKLGTQCIIPGYVDGLVQDCSNSSALVLTLHIDFYQALHF